MLLIQISRHILLELYKSTNEETNSSKNYSVLFQSKDHKDTTEKITEICQYFNHQTFYKESEIAHNLRNAVI